MPQEIVKFKSHCHTERPDVIRIRVPAQPKEPKKIILIEQELQSPKSPDQIFIQGPRRPPRDKTVIHFDDDCERHARCGPHVLARESRGRGFKEFFDWE